MLTEDELLLKIASLARRAVVQGLGCSTGLYDASIRRVFIRRSYKGYDRNWYLQTSSFGAVVNVCLSSKSYHGGDNSVDDSFKLMFRENRGVLKRYPPLDPVDCRRLYGKLRELFPLDALADV